VGSGLFATDEERGRLDLILSHPVGRTSFFFGRLFAFILATFGILFLGWLGFCIPLGNSPIDIGWGEMVLPFFQLFAQTLIYGTLALLLSTVLPSRNTAATVSGMIMVVSYLVSSMAPLEPSLESISYYLPYTYFQGADAVNGLNWTWFLSLMAASIFMALFAWWRFLRRDIRLSGEGSFSLGR
jgi:ABC-2 type transport system permease protein